VAHEIKVSVAAVNAKADAWAAAMVSGKIRLYQGTKPATADADLGTAVLLAEGTMGDPAFGFAANGLVIANAITKDSDADATGTAQFYRLFKDDGSTPMGDGTCGVTGSGSDLEMATVNIVQHGEVTFPSFTHQESLG
jgi:hypothetical protein